MEFKSMWTKTPKTKLDYSRKLEKTYTLVKPYAIDEDSGEFLNDTAEPKLIETEPINVDEKIQSFKDDCDIYKILEKVALSGDIGYANVVPGVYADISNVPNNIHDLNNNFDKNIEIAEKLGIGKELVTSEMSSDELMKLAQQRRAEEIKRAQAVQAQQGAGGDK